jgi:glycosyltransferase involved in cell wall biosynthesis
MDKGVRTLLAAFARAALADARLAVAGNGPLAAELDAAAGVDALGWLDGPAKDEFFDSIDALVVPSQWPDPAPLVVNEARSRGIPVIGTTAGGIPELIDPANRTLLVAPGDDAALADAFARFAAAPDRYAVAAVAAPASWASHLDEIAAAYEDARALRARGARSGT